MVNDHIPMFRKVFQIRLAFAHAVELKQFVGMGLGLPDVSFKFVIHWLNVFLITGLAVVSLTLAGGVVCCQMEGSCHE